MESKRNIANDSFDLLFDNIVTDIEVIQEVEKLLNENPNNEELKSILTLLVNGVKEENSLRSKYDRLEYYINEYLSKSERDIAHNSIIELLDIIDLIEGAEIALCQTKEKTK